MYMEGDRYTCDSGADFTMGEKIWRVADVLGNPHRIGSESTIGPGIWRAAVKLGMEIHRLYRTMGRPGVYGGWQIYSRSRGPAGPALPWPGKLRQC